MAASQAASMSRALTTSMRLTRSGVGRCTGPVTRVTRAPASAAVADYRPEVVATQKLKKDPTTGDGMLLQMVRNPDILATIAGRADRPFSVGFAAETEHLLDYATRKLKDKNLDLIVANDVANPSIGFNSEENALTVIDRQQHQTLFAQTSKGKIARQLVAFIAERLNQVQ